MEKEKNIVYYYSVMYNLILITFRRTNEMAVIDELLRSESNGNISFGNHELAAKAKLEDYEHAGDMYKVLITREICIR